MDMVEKDISSSKKPISTRKPRTSKFGRKTVDVMIGENGDHFTTHEDLLCLNAPYFRRKIQPVRKALGSLQDMSCPICLDALEPGAQELMYCTVQCGRSFHWSCINEWIANPQNGRYPTCPFCREDWPEQTFVSSHAFPELNSIGYSVYQEWLYYGQIYIANDIDRDELFAADVWLEAYFFGAHIEDNSFCDAVLRGGLAVFIEDSTQPGERIISDAYANTTPSSPLRHFLVGLYVKISMDPRLDVEEKTAGLPQEFLAAVTNLLITLARAGTPHGNWDSEQTEADLCIENADHVSGYIIAAANDED